jgi:hypothetical protein
MSQVIKYLSKLIKKDLDKHRFLNRVMENIAFGVNGNRKGDHFRWNWNFANHTVSFISRILNENIPLLEIIGDKNLNQNDTNVLHSDSLSISPYFILSYLM